MQNRKNEMNDKKPVGVGDLSQTLKITLTLLVIIGAIVPWVLGFVNIDYRLDGVELAQTAGFKKDEEQDLKITTIEKGEIARRGEYELLRSDAKRTESKLNTIISELKRLERGD